ncbi:hypothetical protein RclHR1_01600018 [Rhizophagus clarus]|uniref:Crinkler effector protein N-terminal domain-containing protein n=1 Tax=Rhizophagus clarus TaxID=94130 RepID=A0A2Z6R9E1_9GLOM|nr:hypothetical protein RclHR1_01600018 [Rhizophagus clarus]
MTADYYLRKPHLVKYGQLYYRKLHNEKKVSLNCLRLGDTSFDNVFTVNVLGVDTLVEGNVEYAKLKISDLNLLIWKSKPSKVNSGDLELWKVNITEEEEYKLEDVNEIEEIIKEITKDALKCIPCFPNELEMPLQQRKFEQAMLKVNESVKNNVNGVMGKTNYWCLVSGIGKTRFGRDFYYHVNDHLEEWSNVHFEYLCMDFGNGFKLDEIDYKLSASVIIGLRIAYAFFIEKQQYDIKFREFRLYLDLHLYIDLFDVNTVMSSCRKFLKLPKGKQFFLYLQIDEFRLIDDWDRKDESDPKIELFKNMISDLAMYIFPSSQNTISSTFVLPFLSGTAPYVIIKQKDASKISFEFWKLCAPLLQLLLDTGGLPRAHEQLLRQCFWSKDKKIEFFEKLEDQDFNDIFGRVKFELDKKYNIKYHVLENKELATKILYYCIEGIPIKHTDYLEDTKINDLERDGRIILSKCDKGSDSFLMYMPFFFICLYNDALRIVDAELTDNIFRIYNHMFWQQWELFVLHHEAFRTNLAIKMGNSGMRLDELYPGACTEEAYSEIYLPIQMNLLRNYASKPSKSASKSASNLPSAHHWLRVCEANEQFPNSKALTNKRDNKLIDLEIGEVVVLNAASARFADIILVRENGTKILFMIRCKWDYGSKNMTEEMSMKKT